jgi:hypothetical protein
VTLLKIISVLCFAALLLAATGDLAWYLLVRFGHVNAIGAESVQALNRIPVFVVSVLWILAMLLGWIIARKLHLIPQF